MTTQKTQEKKLKDFVKNKYSQIARKCETCCSCNGVTVFKQAEAIGYSLEELKKIPESAILGLGCGNPAGLVTLKKRRDGPRSGLRRGNRRFPGG